MLKDMLGSISDLFKGFGVVGKISVNSVLNSLIWVFALLLLFVFFSPLVGLSLPIVWVTLVLIVVSFILIIGFFSYFAFKNPDYLRSESYHYKKLSIEMMGDKRKELNPSIIEGSLETKNTKLLKGKHS